MTKSLKERLEQLKRSGGFADETEAVHNYGRNQGINEAISELQEAIDDFEIRVAHMVRIPAKHRDDILDTFEEFFGKPEKTIMDAIKERMKGA